MTAPAPDRGLTWLLAPYRDVRTYRSLVHLLTGLPFALLGVVVVITGGALGLGLAVTLVGVPVLVLTLRAGRALARLERLRAHQLLDAPVPRAALASPARPASGGGLWWSGLVGLVRDPQTWTDLALVVVRLPLSILDLTVALGLIGLALGGFAQPVLLLIGIESTVGGWVVDQPVEELVVLAPSLVFVLVAGRLLDAWAEVERRVAVGLVGPLGRRELKRAIVDALERRGSLDAFGLLAEVEQRLGRGAGPGPTRLQAALVGLQAQGRVLVDRNGGRVRYALP